MSGTKFQDGEFRKFLLERWKKDGKSPTSVDRKVWPWLEESKRPQNVAEHSLVRTLRNWAFNATDNSTIWQERKARGYYDKVAT